MGLCLLRDCRCSVGLKATLLSLKAYWLKEWNSVFVRSVTAVRSGRGLGNGRGDGRSIGLCVCI